MPKEPVHLAIFKEDRIDDAAEAVERLRGLGIADKDMSILSGIPYSEHILGRPMNWTRIGLIGMGGALVGFVIALALSLGTQSLYPIRVGNQPFWAIPTSIVVVFELTMLGLLISTFIGVFVETITPSYGPKGYDPRVSDGNIAILFTCPPDLDEQIHAALAPLGAELEHRSEVKNL
ncbi:MAG TPA: quinol:electron acceptor oxidoreductase subunit ActD [Longilinea sp.]|nr:quinol:electron acceptor oxidoreductase subunit ActD [Longilinea sp.]